MFSSEIDVIFPTEFLHPEVVGVRLGVVAVVGIQDRLQSIRKILRRGIKTEWHGRLSQQGERKFTFGGINTEDLMRLDHSL